MIVDVETRAQSVIAGACRHILMDQNAEAVDTVRLFIDDMLNLGLPYHTTLEALARAGIVVSILAAEPNKEAVFDRITMQLALVGNDA